MNQYYKDNKQLLCARVNEYRIRNPELIKKRKQKDYERNKDKILARNAAWRATNPEKKKASNDKWRNENRERHRENSRKWAANNPERFRELQRHAQHRRRSLKDGLFENYTEEEWGNLLHRYDCKCIRCGSSDNIEVDHVVPISKGGTNTIDNLQPLCRSCNAQKWTYDYDYR